MRKANDSKKQLVARDKRFSADQSPKDNSSASAFFELKFKSNGHKH